MAKPLTTITPPDRIGKWKKLWGTPKLLDESATDIAFEEFTDAVVPSHMHKLFLKTFGAPKARFDNRFFNDEAHFVKWQTRLSHIGMGEGVIAEATIIYGSPDKLEAYAMKGETRRSLKDLVIDDWFGCCAIVRTETAVAYVFVAAKMDGCIVRMTAPPEEFS